MNSLFSTQKYLSSLSSFANDHLYIIMIILSLFVSLLLYYIANITLMPKPPIVVVFDMDETLGSFGQLGILKDVIESYEERLLTQDEFNRVIDKHPEFIRPGILEILQFVVEQRKKKHCDSIMIYTNNQGPRAWAESISNYFSYKIGEPVFDHIVAAFMVNGHRVEPSRTSHEKIYNDFIRCARLPSTTEVCFVDDVEHPRMIHDNVYYVKIKPYHYRLPISHCLERIYPSDSDRQLECLTRAQARFHPNSLRGDEKTPEEQEVDKVIGKFMLKHMHDFFLGLRKSHGKTKRKSSYRSRRRTRHL